MICAIFFVIVSGAVFIFLWAFPPTCLGNASEERADTQERANCEERGGLANCDAPLIVANLGPNEGPEVVRKSAVEVGPNT